MQLLNICTKKEYQKDGETKTIWYKVGILKVAPSGKKYIKLFQHPDTEFFVFDRDDQVKEPEQIN